MLISPLATCGMILVMSLCKLTAVRFCLLLSHTHTHATHTQPVVRIYKVPMDAFEGSGGSEEESDEEASEEEEEDEDRGQRSLPPL